MSTRLDKLFRFTLLRSPEQNPALPDNVLVLSLKVSSAKRGFE